jgi:hypothetical protein
MRRAYIGLGVIAALAFLLLRCWQGSTGGPNQPPREQTANASTSDVVVSPTAAVAQAAPAVSNPDPGNQEPLIRRLHQLHATNPGLAVSLAREDRERNPQSPDAEERDMVLVAALHNDRDIVGARNEAWYYFMHYPNGKFIDYLTKLTRVVPPSTRPRE